MEDKLTGKVIWNEAARTGILLGAVCIAYMVLSHFLGSISADAGRIPARLLAFILWAGKFAGCIIVMKKSMERFAADYREADGRQIRLMGTASAFLSALIVAAANLAYISFIAGDEYRAGIELAMSSFSGSLDANSMRAVESVIDKLPVITFFSQIVYCFVYGWVLSAILSSGIAAKDIFRDADDEG